MEVSSTDPDKKDGAMDVQQQRSPMAIEAEANGDAPTNKKRKQVHGILKHADKGAKPKYDFLRLIVVNFN